MSAGTRSLLAPWIGGASAAASAAGRRSHLAPWIGGASAATVTRAGVRSLLAPWAGGAAAGIAPASSGGYRGLLAFWQGGAAAGPAAVQTPTTSGSGNWIPDNSPAEVKRKPRRKLIQANNMMLIAALLAVAQGESDGSNA